MNLAQEEPEVSSALPPMLQGIRVVDLTRFLAGPYATWVLAELGADVIKVEDPDRPDEARSVGPYFVGDQSLYFAALNTGKRSAAIRYRTSQGLAQLFRMVATADVLVENNKPGFLHRLGLDPAALRETNPGLVTCSLSGFGATGPLRERPGYDYTIQALSGVMSMTGDPEAPPGKAGISYVDHSGGLAAALAVCAALVGRQTSGAGRHLDLGLYDVQMSMLSYLAAWQLNAGYEAERTASASHPFLVPAQNFGTTDGFVSVFVGNDAMWGRLVAALDVPALAEDRFATSAGRHGHRDELLGILADVLRRGPTRDWVDLLVPSGVPAAATNSLGEALVEPQADARGLLATAHHPGYGSYRHVTGPLPTGRTGALGPAPLLGEHTDEILRELDHRGDPGPPDGACSAPGPGRERTAPTTTPTPRQGRRTRE